MTDDKSLYITHLEKQAEAFVADLVTANAQYYYALVGSGMPPKEAGELLAYYSRMRIDQMHKDMIRSFGNPED